MLPLRHASTTLLSSCLDSSNELASILKPNIGPILQSVFATMQETESEESVMATQAIVREWAKDIGAEVEKIVKLLADRWSSWGKSSKQSEDEEVEGGQIDGRETCIDAIIDVVKVCQADASIYHNLSLVAV